MRLFKENTVWIISLSEAGRDGTKLPTPNPITILTMVWTYTFRDSLLT